MSRGTHPRTCGKVDQKRDASGSHHRMAIGACCCAGIIGCAALVGRCKADQQAQQSSAQAPVHCVVHQQHQVLEAVEGTWLNNRVLAPLRGALWAGSAEQAKSHAGHSLSTLWAIGKQDSKCFTAAAPQPCHT